MAQKESVVRTTNVSVGTVYTRGRVTTSQQDLNENTTRVVVTAETRSGNDPCTAGRLVQWRCNTQAGHDAAGNRPHEWTDNQSQWDYCNWVGQTTGTWDFARMKDPYVVQCWANYWGADISGDRVYLAVTIPARPLTMPGNPTVTLSSDTVNYGEELIISWAKSATQGNANFDHFEVAIGGKQIYSGTETSKTIVPSDYTGATGGELTIIVKEVHEWYGTYPSTQASKTVTVRSGVVTVYDSSGNKHIGLVTAYDSSGKAHNVLIKAYDSSGKPHNVQ